MKRDQWFEKQHRENLKAFRELSKRILRGLFKISSITIDTPQFGHTRVTILLREEE